MLLVLVLYRHQHLKFKNVEHALCFNLLIVVEHGYRHQEVAPSVLSVAMVMQTVFLGQLLGRFH
jgi:hypothetical protein